MTAMQKDKYAKIKIFLLLWNDLHQNVKDLLISLVIAVFNNGDIDRCYYEISKYLPDNDLIITKTKVYQAIRFILDITPRTAFDKISGKSDFTLSELLAIMSTFNIETLDHLNIILKEIRKGF